MVKEEKSNIQMGTKKMEEEEEDKRRETAISSIPSLNSNFKPSGITHDQLSKFQELHRRRLQIKSKSKIQKKLKGVSDNAGKSRGKKSDAKDHTDKSSCTTIEESSLSTSKGSNIKMNSQQDNGAVQKWQKLHWGLDTKERWERKANM